MESLYRNVLGRALRISWRNKWLWFLGLFAAVIGNGSVYEALLRGFNNISEGRSVFYTFKEYAETGVFGMVSWAKFSALWQSDPSTFGVSLFALVVMMCVLAVLITLGVICQGGLIGGVISLDAKRKTTLKSSFQLGVNKFWPILKLNLITKVILLGILVFLAYVASLLFFASTAMNTFVYILSFIVFIILGIIIYFLTIYGTAYVILRSEGPWTGLKSAWHLFKRNVMLNLEMGLILFIMQILVGIAFLITVFVVLSPVFILYMIFMFSGGKLLPMFMMFAMITMFAFLTVFFGSWWSTYQLGAWSILFEELELGGKKSKVQALFEKITRKKKPKRRAAKR
jgi:hypothetical protein